MKHLYLVLFALAMTACETKSVAEDAYAIQVGMTLKEVNSILDDDPYRTEVKGDITRYGWVYRSKGIQRLIYVDFKNGRVWETPDTQSQLHGYKRE
jgi:hypothetical protein